MNYALLLVSVTLSSFSSFAQDKLPAGGRTKVVYGTDDRKDVKEVTNSLYLKLAESTASMFPSASLVADGVDHFKLNAENLQTAMQVCSEEKYSQQIAGAYCSGFLVGPDLLLTAGHCVEDQESCNSNKWVFDYYEHLVNVNNRKIDATDVFRCKSIVSRDFNETTMIDYALIKLDRVVPNRAPLKYRTTGKIADNASLVVIGNPSGLPTKITDKGFVRANTNAIYFQTNLDTFGGNSGSAVFDATTGMVEGILVRGEEDYILDPVKNCRKVNYVTMTTGRGEDATRITNVYGLKGVNAPAPVVTVAPQINTVSLLGTWKQSVNPNLTLTFTTQNGATLAITRGYTAGVATTSTITIDAEKDMAIDFMPEKYCKMFLRPSGSKLLYSYCGKAFTPEKYFTR